jgi:serine/threonine-protein kinase
VLDEDGGRKARATASVARALAHAPDLAETHLVSAMLAVQTGNYREAAQALGRALTIAPTMPEAQQYLGEMQLEAGRMKEGRKRMALTLELDPTQAISHLSLARIAALVGDREEHARHLKALLETDLAGTLPILVSQLRWALYDGNSERTRETIRRLGALTDDAAKRMSLLGAVAIGEADAGAVMDMLKTLSDVLENPRFDTLIRQIATEIFSAAGELERAAECLTMAADNVLIDIVWMDLCPVLAPLRDRPDFAEARAKVEKRAAEVWLR